MRLRSSEASEKQTCFGEHGLDGFRAGHVEEGKVGTCGKLLSASVCHLCPHSCVHVCIYTYAYIYIYMYIHIYTCAYIYIYSYLFIYLLKIYTCAYIHIYTQEIHTDLLAMQVLIPVFMYI